MTFKVLPSGDAKWKGLIEGMPAHLRDLHFLPEYGRIYEDVYGFKAQLAVWYDDEGYIVQPFVLRPVRELEFMKEADGENYYDLSHPYGYGGPLASTIKACEAFPEFHYQFQNYCDEQGYASEFCSLHPLLINEQKPMLEVLCQPYYQKDVFSVELPDNESSLLEGFSQGHRRNYRKALNAGVRIEKVEINKKTLNQFIEIHRYTMQRHEAAERWWFPEDYFPACYRHLGDSGASIFFAYYKDELASACFLVHAYQTAYYHFGGSYDRFYDVRASNLLMTKAMIWAQAQGYKKFHLGGGVTPSEDDPLIKFKKGFGAKSYPLWSYECVHCRKTYDILSSMKIEHERKMGKNVVNKGYFPLYRR